MRAAPRLALLALAAALPDRLAEGPVVDPAVRPGTGPARVVAPTAGAAAAPGEARVAALPDHEVAARAALRAHAVAWGLEAGEAAAAGLAGRHDPGAGPVVLVFRRQVGGVEVLGEQAAVVLDRAGAAVATLGALDGGPPRPGDGFTLGEAAAAARALAAVAGPDQGLAPPERRGTTGPWQAFTAGDQGPAVRVRRAWLPAAGALEATWLVEVTGRLPAGRTPALVFLGDDGQVRERRSLVAAQAVAYRAFAGAAAPHLPDDGPTGLAGTPHGTGLPDGFQPEPVSPPLVTLAHASALRADPWLPAGATETIGNNAEVYANLDGATGFDPALDVRGAATAPGVFDHPLDLSLGPGAADNRQAGLVHAFYLVNFLHDWLADAGFDEAAGNAQADNLGRGGLGGDRLVVEAQDPAALNQAMMYWSLDGASPVMKVGIFGAITARYVAWGGTPPAGRPANEEATRSAFGAQAFDLAAPLVPVDDGVAPVGDGCDDGPWVTGPLDGKIALLDAAGCAGASATCSCAAKALRAQARGAAGVLIANDVPGYLFLSFLPPDPAVSVPVLGLTQAVGDAFRAAAAAGGGSVPVRMVRSPAAPARDGAVDSLLLAHEWGHLLSNRLVGAGVGLGTLQARSLGEGWSDFLALLLAARAEDAAREAGAGFGGLYTYGSWVLGGREGLFGGPNQSYYFGMRRVPYTTDFTRNALTLRHVQDGEPLPLATPGGAAIPLADNGLGNAEVHNAGEVWASMLWECYAALLRDTLGPAPRLSFDEARARMLRYLVASLRATPPNPTFLDARDALLAVAQAGDQADHARFWQAFARRGAGQGAAGPAAEAADNRPVVESYLSPFPEPTPAVPPPGGGGGCQAGGAGPLSLLALLALTARRRPRHAPPGARRIHGPSTRIHPRTGTLTVRPRLPSGGPSHSGGAPT